MTTTPLDAMFAHAAWANDLLFGALHDAPAADPEVPWLLNHVIAAEHVWLSRIRGEESRVAVWPALTLHECEALARENVAGYRDLLASIARGDAVLDDLVQYRNSTGREFHNVLSDILLHVALHGHYHRGQIAARMRAAGQTPLNTDYITFVRQ